MLGWQEMSGTGCMSKSMSRMGWRCSTALEFIRFCLLEEIYVDPCRGI